MHRLSLTLLGRFAARGAADTSLPLGRRKAAAILAYLACGAGKPHARDVLAAMLWPEAPAASARHSLRQALVGVRHVVPADALRMDDASLTLDPGAIDVDVLAFQRLVADGTPPALTQAAELYGGDLLAGFDVNEAPFEEWLRTERERLRELALEALARLLAHQRGIDDLPAALHTALRLLALDPLQEVVHRTVMRLQATQGRRDAALRQYQTCVDLLQHELGVEPEAETKTLYRDILRQRGRAPGIAEPAPADAPGARATTEPAPVFPPSDPSTGIIGRESEVRRIQTALSEAKPGRGARLIAVLGEAGIGKSRLLAELRASAQARGARVLLGRSYESTRIVPFAPWVDAFRREGLIDESTLAGLGPVWRRELARLFPELGATGREAAGASDDPGALFEAVARFVEHLAVAQPVVVIVEDAHWADDMSVRLLASLARRATGSVTLAMSARDDELGAHALLGVVLGELATERRLERLLLAPLSRDETAELAQRLARAGSDAATLAVLSDHLWQMSHGHPFMIVEAMTAMDQSAPARPSELSLPERVRDVIAGRLERLTDRGRTLVSVAAVIGHAFEFPLLRDASGLDEDQVAEGLEELVRRRIMRVTDERFDFTHDRIREVAVSQLLLPRKRLLHRQVAEALDAAAAASADPPWEDLATHCWEAGLWEKAARYGREAGRSASNRFAEREAVGWFERALAAVGRLPADRVALEETADIRVEMRTSLLQLGDFERLRHSLAEAVDAARALEDPRRVAWASLFAAQFRWWTDETADARTFAEYAANVVGDIDDVGLQVTAAMYSGFAWHNAGEFRRATETHARALTLLEAAPLRHRHSHYTFPLPSVHAHLARSFAELGDFARGTRHAEEAVRLAETTGHTSSLIISLWSLGYLRRIKGDYAAAIPPLERAAKLRQGGVLDGSAVGTLGYTYALTGRIAEGLALMEAQLRKGARRGWSLFRARSLSYLGHAYVLAGRLDDAVRTAAEAIERAQQRGEPDVEAIARLVQGEVAARRTPDDPKPASECFAQALAIATTLDMRPLQAQCHLALGRLLEITKPAEAQEHRHHALATFRALDMVEPAYAGGAPSDR